LNYSFVFFKVVVFFQVVYALKILLLFGHRRRKAAGTNFFAPFAMSSIWPPPGRLSIYRQRPPTQCEKPTWFASHLQKTGISRNADLLKSTDALPLEAFPPLRH
jgi:hypothetical protein